MSTFRTVLPTQLIVGPTGHGVVGYGIDQARAIVVQATVAGVGGPTVVTVGDIRDAEAEARRHDAVHLHFTDRLFGESPAEAADAVERIASTTRVTATLHDLPQPSDGERNLARRGDAYARVVAATEGVVVSSVHERSLLDEFTAPRVAGGVDPARVAVVPLGAKDGGLDRILAHVAGPHDRLEVVVAGYVYPGKGHLEAVHAVAAAMRLLADDPLRAVPSGGARVVVLGGVSAGHDAELESIRAAGAECGVEIEVTGYLAAEEYDRRLDAAGVPLAGHKHLSASRSILDWLETGRRPLVVASRYTQELDRLRPGTMTLVDESSLARAIADAWSDPDSTRLADTVDRSPTLRDSARMLIDWWTAGMER